MISCDVEKLVHKFCWAWGEMQYINYAETKFFPIAGGYLGLVSKLAPG